MLLGSIVASAQTFYESFEQLSLVDAEGQPLASSWSTAYGLSNGWKIINGTIDRNGNSDYTLTNSKGAGAMYTDYYLCSESTSANAAYVFIPTPLTGEVMLWTRSNLNASSRKTSTLKIYEATAEGEVTERLLFSKTPEKGNASWLPIVFHIAEAEGKYLAINLVYTDIDELSATVADGTVVVPTLSMSEEQLDFGTVASDAMLTFTIQSNVTTAVGFDITGSGADAFTLVDAPATLQAGTPATVKVAFSAATPGDYTATLTATADELRQTLTLKGTREQTTPTPEPQPADWRGENFDSYHEYDPLPDGWTADGWYIGEPFLLDTPAAVTIEGGTLITPLFQVAQDEQLQFFFSKTAVGWNSYANQLEISLSSDNAHWTPVATFDKSEPDGMKTIAFPSPGIYCVRFVADARTYLDDFLLLATEASAIGSPTAARLPAREAYSLLGRKATGGQKGIVVQQGKKIFRKQSR